MSNSAWAVLISAYFLGKLFEYQKVCDANPSEDNLRIFAELKSRGDEWFKVMPLLLAANA